jgi:hypothetical protein
MLEFVCTFALLYIIVSLIWPHLRSDRAGDDRRHKEVLDAIAKLERQNAPAPPPPLPTHNSAERARVLALGKVRDGAKRHPILDTPWVRVANLPSGFRHSPQSKIDAASPSQKR